MATTNSSAIEPESCELIRKLAYEFYEQRGREDGHDLEDWLRAEAEIMEKRPSESLTAPKKKAHRMVAA